ncbi:MAG TPA: hypothetical protein VFT74_16425 [Isosphaeraceae bacterium]|nr:hypothetical protein [Isosphaeraceae bacterium]
MYNATVEIEEGLEGLRTGMNARVEFLVGSRENVVRVPLKALRWFDGYSYVAVPEGKSGHAWKPISLGMMSEFYAEVKSGLEPGDQIVADPSNFDPPTFAERERAKVAGRMPGAGVQS